MPEICILVLSGFPASGKSTFAKALHSHFNQLPEYVCYHVCYDAILSSDIELKLLEVRGVVTDYSQKPSQWKEYRKKITKCVEHLISLQQNQSGDIFDMNFIDIDYHVMERLRKTIGLEVTCSEPNTLMDVDDLESYPKRRLLIIIDDTMYYRSMRYDYYQIAKKYQCSFAQLSLECSLETSLCRNHQRSVHVADDVIINMASKFEVPDHVNNAWEYFSLIWNTEFGGNIYDVHFLIERAFENPVVAPPGEDEDSKHEARVVSSTSLVHQSDQILRKLISTKMASVKGSGKLSKQELKSMAACLNTIRSRVLTALRSGELLVPEQCSSEMDASKSPDSMLYQYIQHVFYISTINKPSSLAT